jgi:hypothetical protein
VKSKQHQKQSEEQVITKTSQGASSNKCKARSKCKTKQQETKHNAKKKNTR